LGRCSRKSFFLADPMTEGSTLREEPEAFVTCHTVTTPPVEAGAQGGGALSPEGV
jgi:hypothetical protein